MEEKSVLLENLYNLHRGIDYIYQKQNYKMKLENDEAIILCSSVWCFGKSS